MGTIGIDTARVELKPSSCKLERAKLFHDLFDSGTNDGVVKLQNAPAIDTDQMIVFGLRRCGLESHLPIAKISLLGKTMLGTEFECSVDGRIPDPRFDLSDALQKLFDRDVSIKFVEDSDDRVSLSCRLEAFLGQPRPEAGQDIFNLGLSRHVSRARGCGRGPTSVSPRAIRCKTDPPQAIVDENGRDNRK